MKGLRQVGAKDLDSANQYLEQVYVPLWNRRFRCDPRMSGDGHRPVPANMDLDSVLSIRPIRTVNQDHTVSWDGVIYGIARHEALAACVELAFRSSDDWMEARG